MAVELVLFKGGIFDGEERLWPYPTARLQMPFAGEYRLEQGEKGLVARWIEWEDIEDGHGS